MQSVSSSIWTRVAVFISYDDNNYTTGTGFIMMQSWIYRIDFLNQRMLLILSTILIFQAYKIDIRV